MFVLDYKTKLPIYEQIQSQVIHFIALGLFKPEQQLPAVRQLASDLGVNPNTVSKAYQELERLGFVVSHTGKGTFINTQQDSLQLIRENKKNELGEVAEICKSLGITFKEVHDIIEVTYKEGDRQ
jgi:GntR family transcriptional regulator